MSEVREEPRQNLLQTGGGARLINRSKLRAVHPRRRQPDRDAQEATRALDHIHHTVDQAIHKIAATTKTTALILAALIIVQMITG
jgi:hypothetical protein